MSVMELLRSRFAERQVNHTEFLANAAKAVAAGQTVDHVAVENAMQECGMSLDEFERSVGVARNRQHWHMQADKLSAATKALAKISSTIEKERGEFEAAHRQWMQRAAELDAEERQARRAVELATEARDKLIQADNNIGPVAARLREAQAAFDEANASHGEAAKAVRLEREKISYEDSWIEQKAAVNAEGLSAEDHRRFKARAERRLAENTAALQMAERDLAAATKELQAAQKAASET